MSKILLNYTKRTTSANSSNSNLNGNYDMSNDEININYEEKYFQSPYSNINTSTYSNGSGNGKKELDDHSKTKLNEDSYVTEEVHDDCVYQVTLKKVFKNKTSNNLNYSNNDLSKQKVNPNGTYKPLTGTGFYSYVYDDNSANSIGTTTTTNNNALTSTVNNNDGLVYTRVKIKQLKYATLEKFIEHLTNEETGELDSNLVQTFLATYRTFSDPITVIRMLRKRYEKILPASLEMTEDVRVEHLKSIRSILYTWLEYYNEDFNEPSEYINLNELNKFAQEHFNESELVKLIRAKFESYEIMNNNAHFASSNNLPLTSSPNNENINAKLSMSDYTENDTNEKQSNHRRSWSNLPGNLNYSKSTSHSSQPYQGSSTSFLNIKSSDKDTVINSANLLSFFSLNKKLTTSSSSLDETTFMLIDNSYFAQQLTYIDKCLFQNVCAHHCLGSVWSTRYQKIAKNINKNNTTTSIISNNSDLNGNYLNGDSMSQSRTSISPINNNLSVSVTSSSNTHVLSDKFASIRSFIDQFNCVSFVVQATVLERVDLKPFERAKIIKKWIDIAQECRTYKNFSSLNAIVQGLNTQCVSRLEKTWNEVPSDSKAIFKELTEMFSQDQNQKIFREILMKDLKNYADIFENNESADANFNSSSSSNKKMSKNKYIANLQLNNYELEGTAKYADINSGINATLSRKMKEKIINQHLKNQFKEPLGTVPFLGTFLKDLEYISAQNSAKNEKGLINVMQKRREFEIIAQIKLLQQASHLYNIPADPGFNTWLHQQPVYTEAQNYELSYMIEPKFERENSNSSSNYNRKINKISSSQASRSESIESINSFNSPTNNKTPLTKTKFYHNKDHSRNSSLGSSDLFDSGNFSKNNKSNNSSKLNDSPLTNAKNINNYSDNYSSSNTSNSLDNAKLDMPKSTNSPSEMRVKVNIDEHMASTVVYKLISITDKHRTKDVKRLILEKFFLNPDLFEKYALIQIFSTADGSTHKNELVINDYCNVFYAAKNVPDMKFVLRRKSIDGTGIHQNINNLSLNNINNKSDQNIQASYANTASPLLKTKHLRSSFKSSSQSHSQNNLNRVGLNEANRNMSFFGDLPPQSPNRYNNSNNQHGKQQAANNHNKNNNNENKQSSSSWHLFKKILS